MNAPAAPSGSRYYSGKSPHSYQHLKERMCFSKCGPWIRIPDSAIHTQCWNHRAMVDH